jgi:hypothetical protein
MNNITLEGLAGGELAEKFQKAFNRVLENLADPNTSFKEARKITISLKFTQNEQRDDVSCELSVSEKLAPQANTKTSFTVAKDFRTGEILAQEYGKLRGQTSMLDIPVDEETGEVKEPKILNMRRAMN